MKIYQATAPSNIAFLKYWGKQSKSKQWPAGNSLSMTLSEAKTVTSVSKASGNEDLIYFDGDSTASSDSKVQKQIDRIRDYLKLETKLTIRTENTFPKSCGIASSASGLCALTIGCFAALLDCGTFEELNEKGVTKDVLAHFSRMGSGSAGRSVYGGYVSWYKGETADSQKIVQESDSLELCDLIFVLSSKKKEVGSTEAHDAAWTSPLFGPRLAVIEERHAFMLEALKEKDFSKLGQLLELDAIEMHSVIMTSNPPVNYWDKNTANFIRWIREQRQNKVFEAYVTIDAGPNVHVICKPEEADKIVELSKSVFTYESVIKDKTGAGPTLKVQS